MLVHSGRLVYGSANVSGSAAGCRIISHERFKVLGTFRGGGSGSRNSSSRQRSADSWLAALPPNCQSNFRAGLGFYVKGPNELYNVWAVLQNLVAV